MRIIKQGSPELNLNPKRFICDDCGYVFVAVKGEYEYIYDQHEGDGWCSCKCPMSLCGKPVINKDKE